MRPGQALATAPSYPVLQPHEHRLQLGEAVQRTLAQLPPEAGLLEAAEREAVNDTLSMPGCAAIAAPAVSPRPVTMLTTPSGRSHSATSSPNRSALSGLCSAGLRMTALPHASAGAIFHAAIVSGPFHGMMPAQTPTGSRTL